MHRAEARIRWRVTAHRSRSYEPPGAALGHALLVKLPPPLGLKRRRGRVLEEAVEKTPVPARKETYVAAAVEVHARPGRRAAFGAHPALTNPARTSIWERNGQSVLVGSQVTVAGAVGAAEGRAVAEEVQDNALEALVLLEVPAPDDQYAFVLRAAGGSKTTVWFCASTKAILLGAFGARRVSQSAPTRLPAK